MRGQEAVFNVVFRFFLFLYCCFSWVWYFCKVLLRGTLLQQKSLVIVPCLLYIDISSLSIESRGGQICGGGIWAYCHCSGCCLELRITAVRYFGVEQ